MERRKREAEFQALKKTEQEQLEKEMRAMAELLLDIYEWRQEQKNKENGSNPTGSKDVK